MITVNSPSGLFLQIVLEIELCHYTMGPIVSSTPERPISIVYASLNTIIKLVTT